MGLDRGTGRGSGWRMEAGVGRYWMGWREGCFIYSYTDEMR